MITIRTEYEDGVILEKKIRTVEEAVDWLIKNVKQSEKWNLDNIITPKTGHSEKQKGGGDG